MAPFQLLSETRLIYGIQEIYEFICEKYDDDDDDDDDVFFSTGQLQTSNVELLDEESVGNKPIGPFGHMTPRRRKILASVLPGLLCHFGWWAVMIKMDLWHLFPEKYYMTLTMIVGSIIAGLEFC